MSGFLDKIRHSANKATRMAAFEAEKLRRTTTVQATIRTLKGEAERTTQEVGRVALKLYKDGSITQSELVQICKRAVSLQEQVAANEAELEAIRAEVFSDLGASAQYGRVCPNGHGPLPAQDNFCQVCGAPAVEVSPPATTGLACPNCGVALASGARFCSSCGQTVVLPEPTQPQTSQADTCESCGAELLPDSIFCAECGHKVAQSEEESALAEISEWPEQLERDETAETEIETPWPATPVSETEIDQPDEVLETENDRILESDVIAADVFPEVDEPYQTERPQTEEDELMADEDMLTAEIDETEVVTEKCPSCDALLLPDAVFCAECGHRLT